MILSGQSIQKLLDKGSLKIKPEGIVTEASIKMHLSNQFAKIDKSFVTQEMYRLKPKEFVLALTKEKITMPKNYAGLYDGYTHLARKGVITHLGSMLVPPGAECHITLEIFNTSDNEVLLESDMRVGQLVILQVK